MFLNPSDCLGSRGLSSFRNWSLVTIILAGCWLAGTAQVQAEGRVEAGLLSLTVDHESGEIVVAVSPARADAPAFIWYVDGQALTPEAVRNANKLVIYDDAPAPGRTCKVAVVYAPGDVVMSETFFLGGDGPPVFLSPPVDRTVTAGTAVSFLPGAAGNGPLSFQWRKRGVTVSTGGALAMSSADTMDAGQYDVVVSNSFGSVTSAPFTLRVMESFAVWAVSAGLTNAQSGQAADPDGDGCSNLLEYALGRAGEIADAAVPLSMANEGGMQAFRFTRPKSVVGVSYELQTSSDLVTWVNAGVPAVESSSDIYETLVLKLPAIGVRRFVRLHVGMP